MTGISRLRRPHHPGAALAIGASALGGSVLTIAYNARRRAPYLPRLERVTVAVPGRDRTLRGLRIGFVTDTHLGPFVTTDNLSDALELLLATAPDLLLFGGDYVSDSPRFIPAAAEVLAEAAHRTPLGGFAVLGNHDYANGAARTVREFERHGIRVLRNEAAPLRTGNGDLWIAGIDDVVLGQPDVEKTFRDAPANAQILALWHEPDWAEDAARRGAFLQLSGHSHGGQVRLPLLGNITAPVGGRRFVMGLNEAAGMPVYTSRGAGVFRPPVRVRCAPEVTLLTLG